MPDPTLSAEFGAVLDATPPGQILVVLLAALVVEKQASETTFPARKEWSLSTPVSRIATVWPCPVNPRFQAAGAPINAVLCVSDGASCLSSVTDSTSSAARSCSNPVASTSAT